MAEIVLNCCELCLYQVNGVDGNVNIASEKRPCIKEKRSGQLHRFHNICAIDRLQLVLPMALQIVFRELAWHFDAMLVFVNSIRWHF